MANVPAGSSLASSDAGERQRARDHVAACVKVARDLGATVLAGPMYTPVGFLTGQRRTSEEWKWAVDSWQQLAGGVDAAGIEVGIEPLNRFETYFLNTAADAARLCQEIGSPRIGILVDTFHANIEEKSIGAALRHAGSHLKHLHVCENDRGIPGSGHVAWTEFFSTVADLGYDRWMTIESFGFSLGALSTAAAVWRDPRLHTRSDRLRRRRVPPRQRAAESQRQALTAQRIQVSPQGVRLPGRAGLRDPTPGSRSA